MRTAVTASAVSSARTNRAVRQSIEDQSAVAAPPVQAAPAPDPVATAPAAAAPVDFAAQLEQLADLKAKGILTEEEFNQKKQEILAQM